MGSSLVTGGSSCSGSRHEFVGSIEGSTVKVLVWLATAWVGRTRGPKLIACFLLLRYSSEPLLGDFLVTEGFSNGGSRMSFVPYCEGNSMEAVVWPEVA